MTKLSSEDCALFYKLMWSLQFYVSQQLQLLPHIDSCAAYAELDQADKAQVRNALYEHIDLVDTFVTENPDQLRADELAIVLSWKHFVSGRFYIERFLKKGAILLGTNDPPRAYAVLGLADSLEDIFWGRSPPIYIETVLLPFQYRIVYDGLLTAYSLYFGSGIRGSLKETYMGAKQNGRIIESLDPAYAPQEKKRTARTSSANLTSIVDEVAATISRLRGGESPLERPALSVLNASARLAQAAVHDPDDLDALWELERKVQLALRRLETSLDRAER